MSIDPEKLLFIFIIAVLVLGPDRLPQAARTMGLALGEMRKYVSGFQSEVNNVLAEPKAIIEAAAHEADMRAHLPRDLNGPSPAAEVGTASATSALGTGPALAAGTTLDSTTLDSTARLHRPELVAPSTPAGAPDDPALN